MYQFPDDLWLPQKRGIEAVVEAVMRLKHVCLYSPTGGGKSRLAAELFKWAGEQNVGGCFYVNRRLLIQQTLEAFQKEGLRCGVRAADFPDLYNYDAPVQICSADTEKSRVLDRGTWDLHESTIVVVDEAHLQKTKHMKKLLDAHKESGAIVVLLTATPVGLAKWADEIVISGKLQEYRDCGALVPAITHSISQPDMSKVKRNVTGEYVLDGKRKKIYTQSIVGDVLDRWKKHNPDARPTMMYAPGVAESVWLASRFQQMGVNFCHVDATDAVVDGIKAPLTRSLWEEIQERYTSGDIKGISCRFKLREGVNLPTTYCCLLATPIGSLASYIQTCLDEKTEVLTQRGWLGPDSITMDDTIASLDLETNAIKWGPCLAIQDKMSSETMYGVESPHLSIRVTASHSMIAKPIRGKKWSRSSAEELEKRSADFLIPISGVDDSRPGVDLTDHQLRFLGWWLSDGTYNKANQQVSILQSAAAPGEHHKSITDAIEGSNLHYRIYSYPRKGELAKYMPMVSYNIAKCRVPKWLVGWESLGTYLDKSLAPELMQMTPRQFGVLLETLNLGDGTKRNFIDWTPKTMSISTGNKIFADRIQALCVTSGYKCNVSTTYNNGIRKGTLHTMHIRPDHQAAMIGGANGKGRSRFGIVPSEATERVWCVTTQYGTVVTRRNGKVAIVGNCGRVLRAAPGKDHAIVLDFGGNYWTHGSPNHDRPWKEWWGLPEHAVSKMHQQNIRDSLEQEPIRCPKCSAERKSGTKCPICDFEHSKSQRIVRMEDGALKEVDGELIKPRHTQQRSGTAQEWQQMYFAYKNSQKASKKSFQQMYNWFVYQHHYHPPRNLPFMPRVSSDWCLRVGDVPVNRLCGYDPNTGRIE